ncbi:MAG: ABC transporter substrate-binding protein [Xylophilus ampelinus]
MTASATALRRRSALALLAAPAFVRHAGAQAPTRVVYQTGWLPQPDKGGLYQALATGLYRDAGLEVELRAGGPQLNATQVFLAGKADFVDSDSTRVLHFAKDGLPGVAVAAFGQKALTVLVSHPGAGHDTLESLKGQPLLVSTVGRQTYFPWLKARFGFTDAQVRPYTFSMAPFLVDKAVSMEGFITSEPFEARRAGVEPVLHLLSEHGYQAYSNVVVTSPKMVAERPDVVQRFVDATAKGWSSYLHGDPRPGNALIRQGNPEMSEEKIAFARDAMRRAAIFDSPDVRAGGPGAMSDAQWKAACDTLAVAGVLPAGVDPAKGYTLRFVNKRVGA